MLLFSLHHSHKLQDLKCSHTGERCISQNSCVHTVVASSGHHSCTSALPHCLNYAMHRSSHTRWQIHCVRCIGWPGLDVWYSVLLARRAVLHGSYFGRTVVILAADELSLVQSQALTSSAFVQVFDSTLESPACTHSPALVSFHLLAPRALTASLSSCQSV